MKGKIKPSYGLHRVKLSEIIPLAMPFTINLSVSTFCNFNCCYCYHSLPEHILSSKNFVKQNMSMDMFNLAISQIKNFPNKLKTTFLFGWGEPLCNKYLPSMIKIIKQENITEKIEIVTNGALLSKDTIDKLIDSGLDIIRISLQGITAEKYNKICSAKIIMEDFIENIRYLYNNKKQCQIFVKTADISLDKNEEEKFYDLYKDICDRMFIEKIMPSAKGVDYSKIIKMDNSTTTDAWGNIHETRLVCPLCFYTLNVLPNGDVYPCSCAFEDPAGLGNIINTPLNEIWNGPLHRDFLIMQLKKQRMNNPVCKYCINPDASAKQEDELDNDADIILTKLQQNSLVCNK